MSELDARVLVALYGVHATGLWVMTMAALSLVGGGWGATLLVPLLAVGRTRRLSLYLAGVIVTQATLVFVLKQLVGRPRPCASVAGVSALVFRAPTDPSFPSGHAAGAFAVATFLALVLLATSRRDAGAWPPRAVAGALALWGVAGGIALSRVVLDVHFPVDVAVGALLGSLIGALGARRMLTTGARAPT